jgi:hypothetical protein
VLYHIIPFARVIKMCEQGKYLFRFANEQTVEICDGCVQNGDYQRQNYRCASFGINDIQPSLRTPVYLGRRSQTDCISSLEPSSKVPERARQEK